MGVPGLALYLVWGFGYYGMVTACGSTLGVGCVIFSFCTTILVRASVVSSMVFGVIWPWKIPTSSLIELRFSVPKGENGAAATIFSLR